MMNKKYALISGASSGIGKAILSYLIDEGYFVYVIGINKPRIKNNIKFIKCDFSEQYIDFDKIINIDKLDLLINNAGIPYFDYIEKLNNTNISRVININIQSPIILTKKLVPLIKQSKGRIIFINSTCALEGKTLSSVYSASNFALKGFADSLFHEMKKSNLSISNIYLGAVQTNFYKNTKFKPSDKKEASIDINDIIKTIAYILNSGQGSVIKEITIVPKINDFIWKK